MFPSEAVERVVRQVLQGYLRHPRKLSATARRSGTTVAQLLAAAITEAVRERVTRRTGGPYVLTDAAGMHYWTGSDYVRVDDPAVALGDLACFSSHTAAATAARKHYRSHRSRLKVVPFSHRGS